MVITGCDTGEQAQFEPSPAVFGLMQITDTFSSQLVIVDQSYDIADTIDEFGIRGLTVRVTGEGDTFDFPDSFYDEDSARWDRSLSGWYWGWANFNDSTLYSLQVVMPWDDTVAGSSYMPSPVDIRWPQEGDTLSLGQELVQPGMVTWAKCRNVGYYLLQCVPDVDTSEYDNFSPFLFAPSFVIDTVYPFFAARAEQGWVTDTFYYLRISAYGTEYSEYVQLGLSLGKQNLTDQRGDTCYGVFSGVSFDSVRVFVTE